MKREVKIHLAIWFFAILCGVLNSCGARKAEKNRTSEASKIETSNKSIVEKSDESNVKKTEKNIVDDKNETVTKETSYEPIDPTKPASVIDPDGKKHELNNSKKTTRETTQKNNTKTDNSRNSEEFHKSELSELSESGTKADIKKADVEIKVERSAWSMWNFLWLLIPIGLYFGYKKYKYKIWWV